MFFVLPAPETLIEEIQLEKQLLDNEISEEISELFEEYTFFERNLLPE